MARSCMGMLVSIILPLALVGCAMGSSGSGDDDGTSHVDAHGGSPDSSSVDARIDAPFSSIDAPISGGPDAFSVPDGGIGGTCTTSSQCNQAGGECCLAAIMICFQDPGIPGLCL